MGSPTPLKIVFIQFIMVYGMCVCVYDHSDARYIQLLSFETYTRHSFLQDRVVEGSRLKTEDENKQHKQQFSCCVDR
ncbi:hypothetical protein TNCV_2356351 [Trichonephila clavipes]|nr:hypothetical protein TNCV_2356351 [Trichonephila clavipes]